MLLINPNKLKKEKSNSIENWLCSSEQFRIKKLQETGLSIEDVKVT